MKFNHLSSPSSDVKATADFFVRRPGCSLAFISPAAAMLKRAGFDIVIESKDHTVVWPHNFHLGFELASVNELSELCHWLSGEQLFQVLAASAVSINARSLGWLWLWTGK